MNDWSGEIEAARRREIDVVLAWQLDRRGTSITNLLATLQELEHLGVQSVLRKLPLGMLMPDQSC